MKDKILIKANSIFPKTLGGEKYVSGVGQSTKLLLNSLSHKKNLNFRIELYSSGLNSFGSTMKEYGFKSHYFFLPQTIGTQLTKIEPWFVKYIYKCDLLHIPHNFDVVHKDVRFVATIHDTYLYDQSLKTGNKHYVKAFKDTALHSVGIVTCSENSKKDIVDRFNVPEEKVTVIPWCYRDNFCQLNDSETSAELKSLKIDFPYFVSVSCAGKRKNIRNLLIAYRHFLEGKHNMPKLVLLWGNPPSALLQEFDKEIKNKDVIFLNYISDHQLVALYNGALCTMYPSRYEGFGFPILESFACGTPVMTCNNSSLPEVGGNLAIYVGEDNIDEMVQVMELFSNGKYDIEKFRLQTKAYLKQFSPDIMGNRYCSFYQKFL